MKNYELEVIENIKRTENTVSLRFKKPDKYPEFKPGQFIIAKFNPKDKISRAYSISSAPSDPYLEITVRALGVFSTRLTKLKKGDKIYATAPKGNMIFDKIKNDLVFLAAGTGVAPFSCIIRHILAKSHPNKVLLLYSCKDQNDIIFRKELEYYSENPNIKILITLTREPENSDWKGERERIDEEKIRKHSAHLHDPLFFIVGQKQFVLDMKKKLIEMGYQKDNIKTELW